MYIAEVVPARLRGTLGSINQQAITLGLLLCCVMGALVDWRWLAIIGAMPSAFLIIFMLAMPEAPRWSLSKNRRTEALAALRWLRGPEADIDQECFAIQETLGENSRLCSYYACVKVRKSLTDIHCFCNCPAHVWQKLKTRMLIIIRG